MTQKQIYWREHAGVRIAVHTRSDPTPEDWQAVLDWTRRKIAEAPDETLRYLIVSLGGTVNAKQRGEFNAAVGKHPSRTALLTSSAVARAALIAMSWFAPQMRAFPLHGLEDALEFIGIPGHDRGPFREITDELTRQARAA